MKNNESGSRSIRAYATQALNTHAVDEGARRAMQALLREGSSSNTMAAYGSAIRYWAVWFSLRYGVSFTLPVTPAVVIQFVVDHALHISPSGPEYELPADIDAELVRSKVKARPGPLGLGTVLHRLSVLSKAHQVHGYDNPCAQPAVRELVSRTRRAYAKRGIGPARKDALTKDVLESLLATCDESLLGRRDRALLLFAWATGGRRRSEVVAATVENTPRAGPDAYLYALGPSKTNQSGAQRPEDVKPVLGAAAMALDAWLQASGIRSGPLFRRVRRGDVLGEVLSPGAVRDIVQTRCRLAGVTGNFSAHSLRSGFVTEAGRQNIPLGDTMALTGHASVSSVMGYFRAGNVLQSQAARMFDAAPAPDRMDPGETKP